MKRLAFLLISSVVVLSSCNEDEVQVISSEEKLTLNDDAFAESAFEEVDDLSFVATTLLDEGGRIEEQDERMLCATITKGDNSITVDFGDGCTGPDNRIRAGKIIISRTGTYFEKDAVHTITLENFSVDNIQVEGTRSWTNLGVNDEGYHMIQVTLDNGYVKWPDGMELFRESDFIRTWIRGDNLSLDELHVEGTASGINRNGVSYSMEVTGTLVYKRLCRWEGYPMAVSGLKEITTEANTYLIDYGNGECDNTVTVSVDGRAQTISINL